LLVDVIPYLADDGQIMGHFIAQNNAGDAFGKGVAGHGFGIHGFVVKMFTRNTERYVEHGYFSGSGSCRVMAQSLNLAFILYYLPY
jgi:hypothetical protein